MVEGMRTSERKAMAALDERKTSLAVVRSVGVVWR